jgi:hypothetical protein
MTTPPAARLCTVNKCALGEYPCYAESSIQSFALKQKEGKTDTWSWTDNNGTSYTNSYTPYSYWLENLHPIATADDKNCNTGAGDIDLNDKLSQYDMYYYNNGSMSKIKSYFFRTTAGLPPYFSDPDPSGLVATAQSRL